mgnify:CR=1 FL=1
MSLIGSQLLVPKTSFENNDSSGNRSKEPILESLLLIFATTPQSRASILLHENLENLMVWPT